MLRLNSSIPVFFVNQFFGMKSRYLEMFFLQKKKATYIDISPIDGQESPGLFKLVTFFVENIQKHYFFW